MRRRSIVRRDTSESYDAFLTAGRGVRPLLARFDRTRKKKGSNADGPTRTIRAKITKMKDGRTHLAHTAACGLEGASLQEHAGDTTTVTVTAAEQVDRRAIAGGGHKGYHSRAPQLAGIAAGGTRGGGAGRGVENESKHVARQVHLRGHPNILKRLLVQVISGCLTSHAHPMEALIYPALLGPGAP